MLLIALLDVALGLTPPSRTPPSQCLTRRAVAGATRWRHMAQSALLGPLCSPASVGMCPRRLEQLALWGEDIVKSGQCPFAMTLVARRGKVVSVAKAGNVELDALCSALLYVTCHI